MTQRYYPSYVIEVHIYPNAPNGTDIGLLKLKYSLANVPNVKSICLPEPNMINKAPEYALNAGWGKIDRIHGTLQIGHKLLLTDYKYTPTRDDYVLLITNEFDTLIYTQSIDNTTLNCGVSYVSIML